MSINFSSLMPLMLLSQMSGSSSLFSASPSLGKLTDSFSGLFDNPLLLLLGGGVSGGSAGAGFGGLSGSFGLTPFSQMGGLMGGGDMLSSLMPLLLLSQLEGLETKATSSSSTTPTTTTTTKTTTPEPAKPAEPPKPAIVPYLRSLLFNYERAVDNNGNVNNNIIRQPFTDLGITGTDATDAARVNIIGSYWLEFLAGARPPETEAGINTLTNIKPDLNKLGDLFAAVASIYKNNGQNYNNAQLANLLRENGRQDLASRGGVGTTDIETINAVATMLNELPADKAREVLNKIFPGENENSPYLQGGQAGRTAYANAIRYVSSGLFLKDLNSLNEGVKDGDTARIRSISLGISGGKQALEAAITASGVTASSSSSSSAGSAGSSTSTGSAGSAGSSGGYGSSTSTTSSSSTSSTSSSSSSTSASSTTSSNTSSTTTSSASTSSTSSKIKSTIESFRDKLMEILPMILMMQMISSIFQPAQPAPLSDPFGGMGLGASNPFGLSSGFNLF